MTSLLTFIAAQSQLKLLTLHENGLTEEQVEATRSTAANTECRIIFTKEEFNAYKAE